MPAVIRTLKIQATNRVIIIILYQNVLGFQFGYRLNLFELYVLRSIVHFIDLVSMRLRIKKVDVSMQLNGIDFVAVNCVRL